MLIKLTMLNGETISFRSRPRPVSCSWTNFLHDQRRYSCWLFQFFLHPQKKRRSKKKLKLLDAGPKSQFCSYRPMMRGGRREDYPAFFFHITSFSFFQWQESTYTLLTGINRERKRERLKPLTIDSGIFLLCCSPAAAAMTINFPRQSVRPSVPIFKIQSVLLPCKLCGRMLPTTYLCEGSCVHATDCGFPMLETSNMRLLCGSLASESPMRRSA